MTKLKRPDVDLVLSDLKDFQRDSAAYAFRRMYIDEDATHRFLVADEVGLGKTLVARGVIALTIDHLWESTERIDVLYICSNADIARQNVRRLDVLGQQVAPPDRITLLPRHVRDLKKNKVNFIPLSPGTSFSLRSSEGRWDERVLLYWMLREAWGLGGRVAAKNLFQAGVTYTDWFREQLKNARTEYDIDESLLESFKAELDRRVDVDTAEGRPDLRSRFDELADRFRRSRTNIPAADRQLRASFIADLRGVLASSCLEALEPDLIVLDEFQRFKELLSPETESGALARGLFEYQHEAARARVVLLSATPYKTYTLAHEEENHYRDFVQTLRFLTEGKTERAEEHLRSYRDQLMRLGGDGAGVGVTRRALETELLRVMIRTERLAATEDRDGMLEEIHPTNGQMLKPEDLRAFLSVQKLAEWVEQPDATEYWKSSPYLMSFMETYELKASLKRWLDDPKWTAEGQRLLRGEGLGLPWDRAEAYQEIDPANARLRTLLSATIETGAWRLLWVPPSLPYYESGGAYADPNLKGFTKRLVFGSWVVVPKMLTCLLSYEAERRMIRTLERSPVNTTDARRARRPRLMFTFSNERLTGMPVLGMLYPSVALAQLLDPFELSKLADHSATRDDIVALAQARIEEALRPLVEGAASEGAEDEAWYWAAPILLDRATERRRAAEWLARDDLAAIWSGESRDVEEGSRWSDHVSEAQQVTREKLGRPPADLSVVLAEMAVGGPATCALRAVARGAGDMSLVTQPWTRDAAANIAWSFRSLFNLPEVIALIRGTDRREPYWRRVIEHCVDGNLQAVLDEYAHVLRESLGLQRRPVEEVVAETAKAMVRALTLRTPTLRVDEVKISQRSATFEQRGMRGRFALRFQAEESDGGQKTRPEQVRDAFNSPFWPFVLATTSVGQEGLDFHHYCHAVVHWNLPSNPVDLEQREGRLHRYKGHAVRKNVAEGFRGTAFSTKGDPWVTLFTAAEGVRPEGLNEIFPYWVYCPPGGAKIERHVPFLPLSRDRARLEALRRALAVYRMVFGQPRQEDLLNYLIERLPPGQIEGLMHQARIDLSPPRSQGAPLTH
ncbi:MAG: helicase-related protein [Actinomycetota bacterium]